MQIIFVSLKQWIGSTTDFVLLQENYFSKKKDCTAKDSRATNKQK